ncbi:hypothetical protein KCP75_04550 [Salmonella enterica subsp. enterica]|nr:hypothetical protein KCP75_04550 [Salmonella enterica subsp. enterica]
MSVKDRMRYTGGMRCLFSWMCRLRSRFMWKRRSVWCADANGGSRPCGVTGDAYQALRDTCSLRHRRRSSWIREAVRYTGEQIRCLFAHCG